MAMVDGDDRDRLASIVRRAKENGKLEEARRSLSDDELSEASYDLMSALTKGRSAHALRMILKGAVVFGGSERPWWYSPPLAEAARVGDVAIAKALLEAGANHNEADAWGFFPLHDAATSGHGDMVEFLLDEGAFADAETDDGNTALIMVAGVAGREEVVSILARRGASPTKTNKYAQSALSNLASGKSKNKEASLIAMGYDGLPPHERNVEGMLSYAVAFGTEECVEVFAKRASVENLNAAYEKLRLDTGGLEKAEILLRHGAAPSEKSLSKMNEVFAVCAAKKRLSEAVKSSEAEGRAMRAKI